MGKNMTLRDKVLLTILISLFMIYSLINYVYMPMVDNKADTKIQLEQLRNTPVDISHIKSEDSQLDNDLSLIDNRIESLKEAGNSEAINKQDFLLLMSNITSELDIEIKKFNDFGTESGSGVWRSTYDVELFGYTPDLVFLVEKIHNLGIAYDVKSLSFRQSDDYEWLERKHKDETKLEWFNYTKEELIPEETDNTVTIQEDITSPGFSDVELVSLQDRLNALLGLEEKDKETEKPKSTQKETEMVEVMSLFRDTRLNLDFTIEFTMFRDPSDEFAYRGIVQPEYYDKIKYTINSEGGTKTLAEINKDVLDNTEKLNTEIESVIRELDKITDDENLFNEINKYLNLLKSKLEE